MSITLTPATSLLLGLLGALCVVLFTLGFHLMTRTSEVTSDFAATAPKKRKVNETFILHRITELIGRPFASTILDWLGEEQQEKIQMAYRRGRPPRGPHRPSLRATQSR